MLIHTFRCLRGKFPGFSCFQISKHFGPEKISHEIPPLSLFIATFLFKCSLHMLNLLILMPCKSKIRKTEIRHSSEPPSEALKKLIFSQ